MNSTKIRNILWIAFAVIFFLLINPFFWPTSTSLIGILPAWFVYVLVLMLIYWGLCIVLALWGWPMVPKDLLDEFEESAKTTDTGCGTGAPGGKIISG